MKIGKETTDNGVRYLVEDTSNLRPAKIFDEAREQAKAFVGKTLKNQKAGMVASVSNRSLGKMTSESASRKSAFPEVHALAVANLDQLFETAKEMRDPVPDRNNDPNIKAIHRFDVPVMVGDSLFSVNILVKEIVNPKGNNIYTIDVVKIKSDPAGLLKVADTGKTGLMAFPLAGSANDHTTP